MWLLNGFPRSGVQLCPKTEHSLYKMNLTWMTTEPLTMALLTQPPSRVQSTSATLIFLFPLHFAKMHLVFLAWKILHRIFCPSNICEVYFLSQANSYIHCLQYSWSITISLFFSSLLKWLTPKLPMNLQIKVSFHIKLPAFPCFPRIFCFLLHCGTENLNHIGWEDENLYFLDRLDL